MLSELLNSFLLGLPAAALSFVAAALSFVAAPFGQHTASAATMSGLL